MPSPRVAWRLIPNSYWSLGTFGAIRYVWRAATPRQTPTATHDPFRAVALGRVVSARGLPRRQSGDGLAVCRRSRPAKEKRRGGLAISTPDCSRALRRDRIGFGGCRAGRRGFAAARRQDRRRLRSFWVRTSPTNPQKTSALGRDADWIS